MKKPKRCMHYTQAAIYMDEAIKRCHDCGAMWKAKIGPWKRVRK